MATIDLGGGEGEAATLDIRQGIKTKIDVQAFVSGNYDAGTVSGSSVLTISPN